MGNHENMPGECVSGTMPATNNNSPRIGHTYFDISASQKIGQPKNQLN